MARPGGYASPVNGGEVRARKFVPCRGTRSGYNASQVDELLCGTAAELDAGRSAAPLIKNATFRKRTASQRYDIDAVDWFLDQLLIHPDHREPAGPGFDPWCDLDVAQFTRAGGSRPAKQQGSLRRHFAGECATAWRDFGQQPGTYLRWELVKSSVRPPRVSELRTADQQTLASMRGARGSVPKTVSTAGRTFTLNTPKIPARSTAGSWPPGIAEAAACSWRDDAGRYAAGTMKDRVRRTMKNQLERIGARGVGEFVDDAGTPILFTSGLNFSHRACARVTFPDRRWLRFLVRGTKRANAIMTAVDQDGNKVARYRDTGRRFHPGEAVEIAVHPGRELTDELILVNAISARWLAGYFNSSDN